MSESTTQHRQQAGDRPAHCAVLTISDTRTEADDKTGKLIQTALTDAGHTIAAYTIVKDEPAEIESQLQTWIADPAIEVICTTGGTGIASRDTTIEVVERLLNKTLVGFGELFRMLSWDEVGPAAMLSRAVAGLAVDGDNEAIIFAMPGSTNAVNLAMTKLIVPELSHLVWERKR